MSDLEIVVMPHRGSSNETLENSWQALEYVHSLGCKYFETDVHATADGVVVLYHDDNLKRMNKVDAKIEDLTWCELQKIFYEDGSCIVRLDEALKRYNDMHFNIDLKHDLVVEPMIDLLNSMPEVCKRVCIASFSARRVNKIRRVFDGKVKTSLSFSEVLRLKIASSVTIPPRFLGVPSMRQGVCYVQVPKKFGFVNVVTERFIKNCHRYGLQIHVWVVNEREEMENLLDMGVDGLITDNLSVAKDVLSSRNLWVE